MKTFNEYLKENNLFNMPESKHVVIDLILDSIPTESIRKIEKLNINSAEDLKALFKRNNWPINIPDVHWQNTFEFLEGSFLNKKQM